MEYSRSVKLEKPILVRDRVRGRLWKIIAEYPGTSRVVIEPAEYSPPPPHIPAAFVAYSSCSMVAERTGLIPENP